MIQRIQTIWLLVSAISSGFLMRGGIAYFIGKTGQKYFTGFSGIFKITDSGQDLIRASVPLSLLIILIPWKTGHWKELNCLKFRNNWVIM